ncbi:MAG: HDIG domain-containing protein [Bacillota bacterium]|nr:HDIG domain-containing protein [Bacillota bacterium]
MIRPKRYTKRIIAIASFIISFAIILGVAMPTSYDYRVGDICEGDIFATREVTDTITTNRKRDSAAEQIKDKFSINYELNEENEKKLQDFLATINEARSMNNMTIGEKSGYVIKETKVNVNEKAVKDLLLISENDFTALNTKTKTVFSVVMDEGVNDIEAAKASLKAKLDSAGISGQNLENAATVASSFLAKNEFVDYESTELEKDRVREQIEPTVYKKNQIIVRRGEAITKEQLQMLLDLGLLKGSQNLSKKYALGIFLFLTIVYIIGGYYIRTKEKWNEIKPGKLMFLLFIPILMLITLMLCKNIPDPMVYLIPVPICAILTATFIGPRMASVVNLYIAFSACIMLGENTEYIIAMVIFSEVSSIIFRKVKVLSGYAFASIATSAAGGICIGMAALIIGRSVNSVILCSLLGGANGIISSIVVIGTTPMLENIFDIITTFKLNDLGNPEKSLLKRLMFEAPGTYHHSLMVGNLAEAACFKIDANNQLARVASYYHDIGKLKRPMYFVENQLGENPHDTILPRESAKILTDHVKDGLEIAKQYRLPGEIRDVIAQHHGTTMAGTFYKKELEKNPDANREDFLYSGPKPESKEAAIVMLADSCEAAVRSLDDKSEQNIRAMVTKIIKNRMTEGQLDCCRLSFKELGEIIDAFVTMLGSYFHHRIKYDDSDKRGENK